MPRRPLIIPWILLCVGLECAAQQSAANPGPAKLEEVLLQLTSELRSLRSTLESTRVNQARLTILLERYRLQQEAVTALGNRVEDTRSELAATMLGIRRLTEQSQALEGQLKTLADPDGRAEIENQLREVQAGLAQQEQREQQLRERETGLTPSLQLQQSKLDTLERTLDAIDSSLANEEQSIRRPRN